MGDPSDLFSTHPLPKIYTPNATHVPLKLPTCSPLVSFNFIGSPLYYAFILLDTGWAPGLAIRSPNDPPLLVGLMTGPIAADSPLDSKAGIHKINLAKTN